MSVSYTHLHAFTNSVMLARVWVNVSVYSHTQTCYGLDITHLLLCIGLYYCIKLRVCSIIVPTVNGGQSTQFFHFIKAYPLISPRPLLHFGDV